MSLTGSSHLYCPERVPWDDAGNAPAGDEVAQEWSFLEDGEEEDDSGFVSELMAAEETLSPVPDCLRGVGDLAARQDSIAWLLKICHQVHAHYRFRPATAYLAVNYLDRFLSGHSLPRGSKWPYQLLAVACLALAAKMEETAVPALLDLQVMEPAFVFEACAVRRMELLVMAALRWRLRAVSPYEFLHRLVARSGVPLPSIVFSRASDLVLHSLRVVDFLEFRPSVIAAAAVVTGAGDGLVTGDVCSICQGLDEESVARCHRLMEEYLVDSCPSAVHWKDGGGGAIGGADPPASPVGVLDAAACGSCDTMSQKLEPGPQGPDPSPVRVWDDESPNKRLKLGVLSESKPS